MTDGRRHVVVRPEQFPALIRLHADREWIGFHVAFDYFVVRKALQDLAGSSGPVLADSDASAALALWEQFPIKGLFRDLMILDYLYRLATGKDKGVTRPRDLGAVAEDYAGVAVSKADEHRLRFGEMIGEDWSEPRWRPWTDYAVLDTVATFKAFRALNYSLEAMPRFSRHDPRWGLMTEQLQLRASLALAEITRNGFAVDPALIGTTKVRLQHTVKEEVEALRQLVPDLFHEYVVKSKAGELKLNKTTGTPHMRQPALERTLRKTAAEEGIPDAILPKTAKTGKLQCSLPWWSEVAGDSEFVKRWKHLAETGKLLQYLVQIEEKGDNEIHSEYTVLVRTGRTSAKRPNIQQMPKEAWFRQMFVARPGQLLVVADYAAIELRTLAAVLKNQFGQSTLYDVLKEGRDPHVFTASLVLGQPYEDVLQDCELEKAQKKRGDHGPFPALDARQAAKAVNFGVPGGLGPKKLAAYARQTYGVPMDEKEAKELRDRLIKEVYPELSPYLAEDPAAVLAVNLGCSRDAVEEVFGFAEKWGRARQVEWLLYGAPTHPNGDPWPPRLVTEGWEGLRRLNRNPGFTMPLHEERGSTRLRDGLYGRAVETLTGRPRAECRYTESRNTPFQALAADGAKVALWNLHLSGYRVVAFVHDEVVAEVPAERAEAAAKDIAGIMARSMESVLYCDLPVEVETKVGAHWGIK